MAGQWLRGAGPALSLAVIQGQRALGKGAQLKRKENKKIIEWFELGGSLKTL